MDLRRFYDSANQQRRILEEYKDATQKQYIEDFDKLDAGKKMKAMEELKTVSKDDYAFRKYQDVHRYSGIKGGIITVMNMDDK
jgi:hypothetical protein